MRRGLALLLTLACSSPPEGVEPEPFDWRADVVLPDQAFLAAWMGGPDEALVVGGDGAAGTLLEWDGTGWRGPLLPEGTGVLWWAHGWPGGQAVAVGEGATVLVRRNGLWVREPLEGVVDPRQTFFGVWGAAPDDVWVVGGSLAPGPAAGVILHFDGTVWERIGGPVPAEVLLFKVWGTAPDDVWAVGEDGRILHYDGDVWSVVPPPVPDRLIAVWGRDAGDVYAAGGDGSGVILRWDGAGWSVFAQEPEPLSGVWTAPGRPLFVAGNRGLVARHAVDGTRDVHVVDSAVDFHGMSGSGPLVVAVGANLVGGGQPSWNGTVATHGGSLDGEVTVTPRPDGGSPDAGPDAPQSDAALPGPGEPCQFVPGEDPRCGTGLTCWYLVFSDESICTQECAGAGECGDYGPGACCRRPGPQTLSTVCIPGMYTECSM